MNLIEIIEDLKTYVLERLDMGEDPEDIMWDLRSVLKDDLQMEIEAWKATHK